MIKEYITSKKNNMHKPCKSSGAILSAIFLFVCITLSVFSFTTASAAAENGIIEAGLAYAPVDETTPEEDREYMITGISSEDFEAYGTDSVRIKIVIPADYNNKPVTAIKESAFEFWESTPNISIAEADFSQAVNLEIIGENAFNLAVRQVRNLDLSACLSLKEIGKQAFSHLESITILDLSALTNLETIGEWAFGACFGLKEIYLPGNGSLRLEDKAFAWCDNLHSVYFSDTESDYSDTLFSHFSGEAVFMECLMLEHIIYHDEGQRYAFEANDFLSEYSELITIEITVIFSDADGVEFSDVPRQLKLFNKSFYYEKIDGEWVYNESYRFPPREREYRTVGFWSTMRIVREDMSCVGMNGELTLYWNEVEFDGIIASIAEGAEAISVYAFFDENGNVDTEDWLERLSAYIKENSLLNVTPVQIIDGSFIELSADLDSYTLKLAEASLQEGSNAVCAVLDGLETEFTVFVTAVSPQALSVLESPWKLNYRAYQSFDAKGLKILCSYDDGSERLIENYAVVYQNGKSFRKGDDYVKIIYALNGKTVGLEIAVAVKESGYIIAGITAGSVAAAAVGVFVPYWFVIRKKRAALKETPPAKSDGAASDVTEVIRQILKENQTVQNLAAASAPALPKGLTPRESEIALMMLAGKKRHEIAETLFISPGTVKEHTHNILNKSDCVNQLEFVVKYGGNSVPQD